MCTHQRNKQHQCFPSRVTASIRGIFFLPLLDGSTCYIPMYHCPSLEDTIVWPRHLTSSDNASRWYNGYCLINIPGCYWLLLSHKRDNYASFIFLNKSNALYFIAGPTPLSSGPSVSGLATNLQLYLQQVCTQYILSKHAMMEIFDVPPWVLTPTWIPCFRELVFIWILDLFVLHLLTLMSLQEIVLSRPMMAITHTSSSCAPSLVTRGSFVKFPNCPRSLSLSGS
jgi:hypothetical protein